MAYERNPLPKKKSVLADHKRIGKRLIPPFLQATNLTEISWLDLLLPELLWIGLLNEKYGYVVGAEVALALPRAAMEVTQKNPRNTWFVTVSSYSKLTPIQQDKIVEILGKNGVIDNYRTALHPLTHFYLDCPLNFLSENDPEPNNINGELEKFKNNLGKLFNRRGVEATFAQADAIYIGFVFGKLKVVKESGLANLSDIQDYPKTENSMIVAASVRATINGLIGAELIDKLSTWPAYFWNRGLQLESCDFEWGLEDG